MLRRSSKDLFLRRGGALQANIKGATTRPPPPSSSLGLVGLVPRSHHQYLLLPAPSCPSPHFCAFSTAATIDTTSTTTSSASSTTSTPSTTDPQDIVLSWLDPDDHAYALQALEQYEEYKRLSQESPTADGKPSNGSWGFKGDPAYAQNTEANTSIAVSCNILIQVLADSANKPTVLDKVFAYLGKMRAQKEVYAHEDISAPSPWARDRLIRACARMVRGVQLSEALAQRQQREKMTETQRARLRRARSKRKGRESSPSREARATIDKYVGLAEALYEEHLLLAGNKMKRMEQGQGDTKEMEEMAVASSQYRKDVDALSSAMIYLYAQAHQDEKILALFDRLSGRGDGAPLPGTGPGLPPLLTHDLALAAVVKAKAFAGDPLDAWALHEELEHVHGLEVRLGLKSYMAILTAVRQKIEADPLCNDAAYHHLAQTAVQHYVHRSDIPNAHIPTRFWHSLMKIAAVRGRHKTVKEYMEMMKDRGMEIGPYEYTLLIEALGEAKKLQELQQVEEQMAAEGIPTTNVVILSRILAFGKSYDIHGARRAFALLEEKEKEEEKDSHFIQAHTAMMRAYLLAGLPQQAYEIFENFKAHSPADSVMYSLALRAASKIGGLQMVEALREEMKNKTGRRGDREKWEVELGKGDGQAQGQGQGQGQGQARKAQDIFLRSTLGGGLEEGERVGEGEGSELDMTSLSLLCAYVDAREWNRAYSLLESLKEHKELGIKPYNILLRGLVKEKKYDEALELANQARREGLVFTDLTRKTLAKCTGGLAGLAEEYWTPPPKVYVVKAKDYDEEEARRRKGQGQGQQQPTITTTRADTIKNALVLNLHKLSAQEAELLLARELQEMREAFDAATAAAVGSGGSGGVGVGKGKEGGGKGAGGGGEKDTNNHKHNHRTKPKEGNTTTTTTTTYNNPTNTPNEGKGKGLQDMVLITGYRRHLRSGQGATVLSNPNVPIIEFKESNDGSASPLKEVVREFLGARGIFFYSSPSNPGRIVVPQASIGEYFERQKKAESEVKFFRLTLLRYIPIASLSALFFLMPKEGLPF